MSSWSYALTNKGRQLQAKAQAGVQLVYTRMGVGSGTLSGQSLESMTALITPVKDLTISRLKRPAGATRALIGATLTNQDVTTGFYLREVGIFATDPDDGEVLYMYANSGATADYITPQGDGVIEKALNMNVFVGAAANITANIDESLVYVTQQELADAIGGIRVNDASTTQKGIVQLSNATNSTSDALAATPKAVKEAYDTAKAAQTTANAANEEAAQAKQAGNERKAEVVAALVAKGVSASTSESWDSLISKLAAIIKATGNASIDDVLTGKTFSNATGNNLVGNMPDQGAQVITPTTEDQLIPAGYHNGNGVVKGSFVINNTIFKTGTVKAELFAGYTPYFNSFAYDVNNGIFSLAGMNSSYQPMLIKIHATGTYEIIAQGFLDILRSGFGFKSTTVPFDFWVVASISGASTTYTKYRVTQIPTTNAYPVYSTVTSFTATDGQLVTTQLYNGEIISLLWGSSGTNSIKVCRYSENGVLLGSVEKSLPIQLQGGTNTAVVVKNLPGGNILIMRGWMLGEASPYRGSFWVVDRLGNVILSNIISSRDLSKVSVLDDELFWRLNFVGHFKEGNSKFTVSNRWLQSTYSGVYVADYLGDAY